MRIERQPFSQSEILRESEVFVGSFVVSFLTVENKLLSSQNQTVIEVRRNLSVLPTKKEDEMEDPTWDLQRPTKITLNRELSEAEKQDFLERLKSVDTLEHVFDSLIF